MAIRCYLAMTAGEIVASPALPPHPAWMACHFSSYSTGLSNLPRELPEGAMVIVNDRTPVQGHDPAVVVSQLQALDKTWKPAYFLLDLQRPADPQTAQIVGAVVDAFGNRVGVSEIYAEGLDCPVFVGACPLRVPLSKHLKKWAGREIWLEAALEAETVTVGEDGSRIEPAILQELGEPAFFDDDLCCRYRTELLGHRAVFTVQRDQAELEKLLDAAEKLGVKLAVGLYQQLGDAMS